MLAGVTGHLVSTAFLEARTSQMGMPPTVESARRQLTAWRSRCAFGPASSIRTLLEAGAAPLFAILGFDSAADVEPTGRLLTATLGGNSRSVALVIAPWGERFDPLWRLAVVEAGRRSAAWSVIFDGQRVRVVDASRLYARRFVEFDLDLALDYTQCLAALWHTMSAAALTGASTDMASLHEMVRASDRHAAGVCRSLRDGVVAASGDVLGALVDPKPRTRLSIGPDSFEQALTIVYRILFLLFAEARALVPLWHPVYRHSYSVEALREIAELSDRAPGLWDTLRAMTRLAHSGCRAGDLRVTPFNGRLFAPSRTPLAERRNLDDDAARRAVLALSTRQAPDRAGRERIEYRDLGVEQLGAVYETLLEYKPRITPGARTQSLGRRGTGRPIVTLETGSGLRKSTGTFYTPQPIADYLVRRTLAPLTLNASSQRILQLRVVDPAMGSGAFLVAACRYLAHAYEQALVREGACHPGDLDECEQVVIRRTIAERCLYGVDLNPMAVQLARLSLWLATLAADRPLSFLDHRLQAGDSLLGVWIANLRNGPDTRRRAPRRSDLPLFHDDDVGGALRAVLPLRFSLENTPTDSLDEVRRKERTFAAIMARESALSRWKRVADLWCAAWFTAKDDTPPSSAFGALTDAVLNGGGSLPGHTVARYLDASEAVAASRRFFHWELEFPEVFFDRDGRRLPDAGFDAVLGNPPWDMIRADAGSADARAGARDEVARVVRFTRDAGIYEAQSEGHANRYQLFVERAMALTRPAGRIGLVLPSGLAMDHGSARLRKALLSTCDVDAIVGIDNRRGVFPIHRGLRFLLVTASAGLPTRSTACRLDLDDPADLESLGDEAADASRWFSVKVSPAMLERLSGPDLSLPVLRNGTDVAILERAAALFPAMGSTAGWSAHFGRELNATDDRVAFRPPAGGVPVVEGKHLEPFRADLVGVRYSIAAADLRWLLRDDRWRHPRLAYRDVASATNKVTLIAAVLPAGCVSTHTVFCLRTPLAARGQAFLCGLFNSLVVNYLVRLRVTTHVTTATVERLPIPTATIVPAAFREIAALARVLARRWNADAFARLNARVAALYQLSPAEFEYVLGTFPLIAEGVRAASLRRFVETTRR